MKIRLVLCGLLALAVLAPPAAAQIAPPAAPDSALTAASALDTPPPELAARERARTRRCVPALGALIALDEELAPLFERADRIQALNYAVGVEDSTRVAPFDLSDPVEAAVRDWFLADWDLAMQYVETGDEALQEQRDTLRAEIRAELQAELDPLAERVDARLAQEGEGLETATAECDDAVLVRSEALSVCETVESPVCEEARTTEPGAQGRFLFVEEPGDLWDMEQLRPWNEPVRLRVTPDGGLGGARAAALSRRGNLILSVGIEPLLQDRSALGPEEAAEYDAHLDSLDVSFDDPRFAMVPALTIQLNLTQPLGGETHYVLHFGNLSDPLNDVIWTAPAATIPGPLSAVTPAPGWVLNAIARGDPIAFTALRVGGEGEPSEPVFVLPLTPIGQARSVSSLLTYIASGQMERDLAVIAPPADPPPGAGPGR